MPLITKAGGRTGSRGRSVHAVLLGALGSLLKLAGIAAIALVADVPDALSLLLRALAEAVRREGFQALTGIFASLGSPKLLAYPLEALAAIAGVVLWFLGGRLLKRGWKALTSRWSRRARLTLILINAVGTLLWILGLLVLAYPIVSAYLRGALGSTEGYLEAIVSTARSVHAALLAFAISALTPVFAGLLHTREAWRKGGKIAAMLFIIGGLVYGVNAIIVYVAWRSFTHSIASSLPHVGLSSLEKLLTPQRVSKILEGLADIMTMLGVYLKVAIVAYALWTVAFLAAWWDYFRASRGT